MGLERSEAEGQYTTRKGEFRCLAIVRVRRARLSGTPTFDTPYQAVLRDTGLVYYGKVTGLDTDYPVLHDAYYVQQATDEKTSK